jgi:hypothetical protein
MGLSRVPPSILGVIDHVADCSRERELLGACIRQGGGAVLSAATEGAPRCRGSVTGDVRGELANRLFTRAGCGVSSHR